MGNDALRSRKAKVDEPSSSKKKVPSNGKNRSLGSGSGSRSGLGSGDSSGLRRSTREMPSKKKSNSSNASVRKSKRIEIQTPLKTRSAKKKNQTQTQSFVRKVQPSSSRASGKGSTSKGGMKGEKKHKTLMELAAEAKGKGVAKQGKSSRGVGTKRKNRMDSPSDGEVVKPSKKKIKVSDPVDSAEKTGRRNPDGSGDNGSKNDGKVRKESSEGAELKEDCVNNVEGDTGVSDSDVKKHVYSKKPKPCKSKDVKHRQISGAGNLPAPSSGIETKDNEAKGTGADCSVMEKNQKIQSGKQHIASSEQSSDDNGLRCNLKGTILGPPIVGSKGTHSCSEDILPSVLSACKMSSLIRQCDKCFRKRRLDYNSPKEELCCCLSNSIYDVDIILAAEDRGECGTCVTAKFAEKHVEDVQLSDPPVHVEQSTCATCKHLGNLLYCGGRGCKRGYHPSCLSTPEVDKLLIWYCFQCIEKIMSLGVHSVTEGIESIWDARELQLLNSRGVENQKQYLVKYKGLSHIHNHWVPEVQLLHEVPELLAKFSGRKEAQWQTEWTVPHRLLLKRSIAVADGTTKHKDDHAGNVSDGRCEWLVKWVGLDYDQATWESVDFSCFKTPVVLRLIQDYETRHDKARKLPLSGDNEIQERKKGSRVKSGKHSGGVLSGADSCYLNCVNKLREYHHKGHNAVLNDMQDRVLKVSHLVSSLIGNVQGPFLVITPHASLSVWEMEFLRIDSSVNVVVYCGSTDARKITRSLEFYEEGGSMMLQVLLSSVEVMSEELEELKAIKWEAVIVDDCQQSSVSSHLVAIKKLVANWRLLLLNAELKDNVSEYVNILSLLESGDNSNQNLGLTDEANGNLNILKERLSSHIVFPRFLEYWVPVQISNLQLEQYCSLILSNSTALCSSSKSDPVGTLRETVISTRKCCDHPYILDPSLQSSLADGLPPEALLDLGIKASGKLLLLDEILLELRNQELKVLILYQSIGGSGRDTKGDILDDFLRQKFGTDSYEHVDGGGCIFSKKQAALDKFNRGRERSFFLLETRACFPSIKLSTVDAVIIFDSDWNPLNDLRALQRISIDSKLEQIKVLRLYCSCTVEEKVLHLAKNDMILDSTLQGISPSSSHMLLMWGSSYLFTKLDEFHRHNVPNGRNYMVPEYPFLKDVCEEILCLFRNNETLNCTKFISVARQIGGSYINNTCLIGEQKVPIEDRLLPHAFWMNLLEGKQPKWKYVSGSCQRNRKRVRYSNDSSMPSEVQIDVPVRKSRKMDSTKRLSSSKVGQNVGKLKAADKDYKENLEMSMANNTNFVADIDLTLQKSSGPTLPCMSNDSPETCDLTMKFNEQTELLQMLKTTTSKLCEILLLKDDGKLLAEQFLEYIVKNHRVTREPETMLQAFEISVCWTAAALLNQSIDHKESLATAREKMNFGCSEDEADFMFSKLKLLKKMFLLRSEVFRFSKSSNDLSDTNGIMRDIKKNDAKSEKNSLHTDCSDKQAVKPVQIANKEINNLRHIRKIKKKCHELMKSLENKQHEEIEEINKKWEEERVEFEKKSRKELAVIRSLHDKSSVGVDKLRILDDTYTKKREDLESQILTHRKELESKHQSERNELQKKATRWLEQVKYLTQEELLDKPTSENEQLAVVEQVEPIKLSNGTTSNTDKLQQNSNSGTSGTQRPEIASSVPEIAKSRENIATSDVHSVRYDRQMLLCQGDAIINSSEAVVIPKVVGSHNMIVEDLLEHSPTSEMDKDTLPISSVEVGSSNVLEVNQVNGNNNSLFCGSTEPLFSFGICLTEHPLIDVASTGPLSVGQGLQVGPLQVGPCGRLVGAEEQVQHISEPLPSNTAVNKYSCGASDITPSHDHHQERDASSGRLNNVLYEFHTSVVTTTQQEGNSAGVSVEAGSQCVPDLAIDHAADANFGFCETSPSTTRNVIPPQFSPPDTSLMPAFTIFQLPFLSSDPLQNESERIRREIDQIMNIHGETKLRLKSECDKEIEASAAQIRMKYDGKLKESDASFSLKRNELQMNYNMVMMHKFLAEAFKSKCSDTKTGSEMQQAISKLTEHLSHLPSTRPSSTMGSFSGRPSVGIPHNVAPPVRAVHCSVPVSNPTTRSLHINPVAPMPSPQQVRSATYAPSLHLEPFRSASVPVLSSYMPSVLCSVPDQWAQRPANWVQGSSSVPLQPPELPPARTQFSPKSNDQSQFAPNLSISATELLMEIAKQNDANLANNVAPMRNKVQSSESWDVLESWAATDIQPPPSLWAAGDNVVCLSDDE